MILKLIYDKIDIFQFKYKRHFFAIGEPKDLCKNYRKITDIILYVPVHTMPWCMSLYKLHYTACPCTYYAMVYVTV